MSFRMELYRQAQEWLIEPLLLPRWMSDERIDEEKRFGVRATDFPARRAGVRRAWFHAASVGELESLTPVIETWVRDGSEAIVSVLSESAGQAVKRFLKGDVGASDCRGVVLYAGYSPWEGGWSRALAKARPDVFVTAKYEAWPELWASLGERDVPLLIVGAKSRRSLRLARPLCSLLGAKAPRMGLLCARQEDVEELKTLFTGQAGVEVLCAGEPRWDRVYARAKAGNERARTLIERFSGLPRPWGVLAQVWADDMEIWRGELGRRKGTLWVVPHKVDARNVEEIESYLAQSGVGTHRTSLNASDAPLGGCIVVDELGSLLELYAAADWAYVGGGFGVGMHSTIEPALHGIPIACGPQGEGSFPEIAELSGTEQLTIVRDREELERWLERSAIDDAQRARWMADAEARLGATRRVLDAMQRSC